jgi:hypothetical protein
MYENLIDPQIQILERCQVAWGNMMPSLPDDFSPYGVTGLTKIDVEKSFSMIIDRLESIKAQTVGERNPFLIQVLAQNFPSWTTPLESWIPSATSYISSINSHLSSMWTTLNSFEPNKEELNRRVSGNKNLELEAKNLLKITANLTRKKEELTEALTQSKKITKEYNDLLAEVQKSKVVIETDALVAVAHREGIVSDKAETDAQLKILKAVTEKLPEFEEKRDAITKQCDAILAEAKDRLDAASRAGMATSFSRRADEYDSPREGWLFIFLMSLAGIFMVAGFIIIPEFKELKLVGSERFFHFLTDIPLTLPFIWLAWFSALRFSQLGRLREDYAFKVATALSLDGYRKQAGEVSSELEIKLLDLAITNFGENPLRLMTKESAKDAHPLAGFLDDKTLIEVIKALSDKVRK